MSVLLSPGWWWDGFTAAWAWWAACVMLSLAALPLTLRLFRGLADRGAGLGIGFGLAFTLVVSWFFALEGPLSGARSVRARAAMLAVAAILVGVGRLRRRKLAHGTSPLAALCAWWPAIACGLMGVAALPHTRVGIGAALIVLLLSSAAAWIGDGARLVRETRRIVVPLLCSQFLFLVGFVFFVNVRTYIPWATWDVSLGAAEKMGNLMHLSSAMQARTLPPSDAWFLGEPTNYYYGGHLAVATLAKLTGTPAPIAFNLGIATIFGLTLSMGFSFVFNLRQRTSVRCRVGGIGIHRGVIWAALGALAIGCFGNLDAVLQWGARDPGDLAPQVRQRIVHAIDPDRVLPDAERESRVDGLVAEPGTLKWNRSNLARIDYWRSSRTFTSSSEPDKGSGTITEFPYFSAILGDMHPHHMAVPFALLVLSAVLSLMGLGATDMRVWWKRGGTGVLVLGFALGVVFTVNIWDAMVWSPLALLAIMVSMKRISAGRGWQPIAFAGVLVATSWLAALLLNARAGVVPVFANPAAWGIAMVALVVAATARTLLSEPRARSIAAWSGFGIALLFAFVGGWTAERGAVGLLHGSRDALVMLATAFVAARVSLRENACRLRWFAASGSAYALCGATALLVSMPFRLNFTTPIEKQAPILLSVVPPQISVTLLQSADTFWTEFWQRSIVNPFGDALRTHAGEYLVHWGLFLVPVLCLLLVRLAKWLSRGSSDKACALLMVLAAVFVYSWNELTTTVGPLALVLALVCALLAFAGSRREDSRIWPFLAVAFFWHWFVEVLHFDDEYAGDYERYNTPFKVTYPTWIVLAAGMCLALRSFWSTVAQVLGQAPRKVVAGLGLGAFLIVPPLMIEQLGLHAWWPVWGGAVSVVVLLLSISLILDGTKAGSRAARAVREAMLGWIAGLPATLAVVALAAMGLLYPYAATATRTSHLHAVAKRPVWMPPQYPDAMFRERTLDATAWLSQLPTTESDAEAMAWLRNNAKPGERLLEAPPTPQTSSYSDTGRFAATTGLPTALGWSHHEMQWRGWRAPVSPRLLARFAPSMTLDELGLADIARELFPNSERPQELRALKLLATAPPDDRPSLVGALLPEMAAEARARLLNELGNSASGNVTMMDFMDRVRSMAEDVYKSPEIGDSARELFRLLDPEYLVVGSVERQRYAESGGLEKFRAWEVVFEHNDTRVYRVPRELRPEGGLR